MSAVLRYFKKHILLVSAAFLISILTRLASPVSSLIERQMIDLITAGDMTAFRNTLCVAGAVVIGTALAYFINAWTEKYFQAKFEEDLRNDLYDGLMRQSHVRFSEKDTAEQMSVIMGDASTICNNFTRPVFTLVGFGFSGLAILIIMFYYSPFLAVVSLCCAAISTILPLQFNKRLGELMVTQMSKRAALNVQLKEAMNGHETISAFGVFQQFRRRFADANSALSSATLHTQVTVSGLENVSQVISKVVWFIAFLVAGSMAVRGDITIGTLVMFISLFSQFTAHVTMYAQLLPLLFSCKKSAQRVLSILDDQTQDFTGTMDATCHDAIEVSDLSFRYSEDTPVLEHLNMTVKKGEKVALIGASGCGKSTLIKLLSGNYSNYHGSIRYDGVELHEIAHDKLRQLVTVIHQNTYIFNDTIRFNICMGEDFSEEALQKALHLSGVDRFLPAIPQGIDGACGENGSCLSGGQKQRIALARALIRGVNVLILDEGVSAIDVETANEIEQELLDMRDLTLLTITHRIKDGLTEQYDRVLSMENGKVSIAEGVKSHT